MIQRDFIKRQLEEFGRAFGKVISDILKLKTEGKVSEGITLSQGTLKDSFDLDIEKILSMPLSNFIESLVEDENMSLVHLGCLGDLFYVTAELYEEEEEKEKAKHLYQKVLTIFDYLNLTERTFSLERNYKMETIKFRIGITN